MQSKERRVPRLFLADQLFRKTSPTASVLTLVKFL